MIIALLLIVALLLLVIASQTRSKGTPPIRPVFFVGARRDSISRSSSPSDIR
jgi:hypothetical protein